MWQQLPIMLLQQNLIGAPSYICSIYILGLYQLVHYIYYTTFTYLLVLYQLVHYIYYTTFAYSVGLYQLLHYATHSAATAAAARLYQEKS